MNNNTNGGVGLGFILFVVFLVLKLTGLIDWSWWWVTAPLWIGAALGLVLSLVVLAFMGIATLIVGRK